MARISVQRKAEIVSIFQASFKRDNSADVERLTLAELRDTDEMLADRDLNAGFRLALRNRIKHLEEKQGQRRESHIRAWDVAVGVLAGILITVVATWLTK